MANFKTKKVNSSLLTALMYIVVGLLFCIFRASVLNWLLTIVGVLFIVLGVLDALNKNWVPAAVDVAIGAIIILGGWLFVEIVLIVFGVLIALKGVTSLMDALKPRKKSIADIVFAGLTIFVGVMLVVSKWLMLDWFFIVLGIVFIVDGILELCGKQLIKK